MPIMLLRPITNGMKHQSRKGRSFGRVKKVRKGLIKSLAVALIENEKIITTEAKAKELSRHIEPYITRARQGTVMARRELAKKLPPKAVKKLVDEIAPRYAERPGGYTRITKLKSNRHDAAPISQIEFV